MALPPKYQWLLADYENVRGCVLAVHGFNNHPGVMDQLGEALRGNGFHVLRLGLSGHVADTVSLQEITAEDWTNDIEQAHQEICRSYPGTPIYNISYSLGALSTVAAVVRNPNLSFSKFVLLAPALSLMPLVSRPRFLTALRSFGISLPSVAPRAVSLHRFIPLQAYHALYSLVNEMKNIADPSPLAEIPTKIFLNRRDRLVNFDGLCDWTAKNRLDSWLVEEMRFPGRTRDRGYHLVIEPESIGLEAWERLIEEVTGHFAGSD